MDIKRAQEIAASAEMANVSYKGNPIYIQNVSEQNETARIYPLGESENEQDVSLDELNEDYR